jgi:hypothetical protein
MSPALRALLSGIIDYAGLFPPASLPLEQAIRNYARYRTEPEAWMLGRFVCPVERLKELSPFVGELFGPEKPLELSILERKVAGLDSAEADVAYAADCDDINSFWERYRDSSRIEVTEKSISRFIASKGFPTAEDAQKPKRRAPIRQFFSEIDVSSEARLRISQSVTAMRQSFELAREVNAHFGIEIPLDRQLFGFKLRCGGLTPGAFPPAEQIAFAIIQCRDANIPFKATAGLHHPVRQYRAEVKTKMHGFLNVFGGGVLAHANWLTVAQLQDIILDEDPKHFVFEDSFWQWTDGRQSYGATIEQIETARRQLMTSFGSCSFDEPMDDLRALGLL